MPLATTQAELTPLQHRFLELSIPEAWGLLHGRGSRNRSGRGDRGQSPNLRKIARQRQKGR